jgi:MFS family permease
MAIDETSPRYEGWRVAAASSLGVFVGFASLLVYTFGIFLKPMAAEFGWSREAVSAAFGVAAMTVALCSPPLGYLLDRIHPRRIIVPCLVVFGGAFASLSLLTPHLWHHSLVGRQSHRRGDYDRAPGGPLIASFKEGTWRC